MKLVKRKIIIVIFFVLICEIILRVVWGFGNPVLYIEDKDFEYIYKPQQDVMRLGNHTYVNDFSMRSKPLSDKDKIRILKFGDSVINGGTIIDHNDLASTILEDSLNKTLSGTRVLNISAGSWGPDNAFAYLKKFGNFDSKFFVLVFSSDDLSDIMDHRKIVGVDSFYPDKKPLLAITEIFSRYFVPWMYKKLGISVYNNKDVKHKRSIHTPKENPGFQLFFDYAKTNNIKLIMLLHPSVLELQSHTYSQAGKRIIELCKENNILCIEGINYYDASFYSDGIHLNKLGHHKMAEILYPFLKSSIQ